MSRDAFPRLEREYNEREERLDEIRAQRRREAVTEFEDVARQKLNPTEPAVQTVQISERVYFALSILGAVAGVLFIAWVLSSIKASLG